MKKVININFQGRVIPIEETAYEMLQNYIASLRSYFANEEGRDEIINDIENRIGELLDEKLKKGSACIVDADVSTVINNMGRPEDFDQEADQSTNQSRNYTGGAGPNASAQPNAEPPYSTKRLYRDEEDKILGGVASGLAHYLHIDPAVSRILFAILAFAGGSGFLIYIILWIVLPSRSLLTNIRKRLYRDTEDRVISGVCGGMAKYFDINPAIPRLIFAAPFIFGIITSIGRSFFNPGSVFVGSFSGGTFILVYIILWIVLPEARTASEKLEMKGEKVDLNSIRNTVMDDLQGFKGRAEKIGSEIHESATRFGQEIGQKGMEFGNEIGKTTRTRSGGLGNAIAILAKAFVYLVAGSIAIGLFVALIALLGSGIGVLPLRDFLLLGTTQSLLAWASILLFIGIPVIAILVWFIRRLMRVKTHNKYIGYGFSALWIIGLFCVITFIASISRDFSSQVGVRQDVTIEQPAGNVLNVAIGHNKIAYYDSWFDFDGILSADRDSLFVNTARVNVVRSKDSLYHVHVIKMSKGRNRTQAQDRAEKITFTVNQVDSMLYLPETFGISKNQKWRNQRVILVIEVPVGKKIYLDERVNDYDYFNVDFGRRRDWRMDWERSWENGEYWHENEVMTMTTEGLESEERKAKEKKKKKQEEEDWNESHDVPQQKPASPDSSATPDSLKKTNTYQYQSQYSPDYQESVDWEDAEMISEATESEIKSTKNLMSSPLSTILRFR